MERYRNCNEQSDDECRYEEARSPCILLSCGNILPHIHDIPFEFKDLRGEMLLKCLDDI